MKKLFSLISLLSLIFCLSNCASTVQDETPVEDSIFNSEAPEDPAKAPPPEETLTAAPPTAAPPAEPAPENCLLMANGGCPGDPVTPEEVNSGEVGFHNSNGI